MTVIDEPLLESVAAKAIQSPRKRMNHNFHTFLDDPLQRMLNWLEPDTYIQPHKHEDPDKCEAFILLKGKVLVLEFDEKGKVTSHAVLTAGTGVYGAEIAPRIYHCILPVDGAAVVYEVKNGPYSPLNDKNFAQWAPKEGEERCKEYREQLLQQYGELSVDFTTCIVQSAP
ncbi:MAG: WbuC family cupin fold metalloprotein [Bacteroidales bacterium]|jgi:cupin fold WbuC family metalloprotein|nr:WbuC family cupin fold metalloprotein [Bacteroidales bacterium]